MAIIASWSPIHGQAKCTVNAGIIAAYLSMAKDKRVLLIDGQLEYGRLKEIIRSDDEDGINQIFTYAHTGNLDKEKLKIYTTCVIEKRLYMIGAPKHKVLIDELCESFGSILKYADEAFDFVMVDLNAGLKDPVTQCVLQAADMVIVNLPQDDDILKKYFGKEKSYWPMIFERKQLLHVIGDYRREYEHYSIRKIQGKFKLNELYAIPNNKYLHKAITDKRFMNWIISNYDSTQSDKQDYNYSLFSNLERLINRILQAPRKKNSFEKLRDTVLKNVAGM